MDREREIQQFIPEEYWTIASKLISNGKEFEAKFYGYGDEKVELQTEADVQEVYKRMADQPYVVQKVTKRERKRNPAPPFITSSLQQEAARKLNFRTAKTMRIAQELYEGIDVGNKEGAVGLITYMRTDSTRISVTAQEEAKEYILEKFGAEYVLAEQRTQAKNENAQDAHEAIRPTAVMRTPDEIKEFLSRDQLRLYRLIWERFLASQMSSAVLDTMSVDIAAGDVTFRATGSKVKFPGFMKVYIEGNDDGTEEESFLPPIEEGQTLEQKEIEPSQHFTQPPPRYSEARLVKTLEERGIGRPSTYAPTLETVQKRGYVALEEKRFIPTELGEIVITLMEEFFPEILDVEFTAHMENGLDSIEEGIANWVEVLDAFYGDFAKRVSFAEEEMKEVELKDEESDETCELCGRVMVYKLGRFGKFLACSGFPDCRNTKPIVKEIGVKCPQCETGEIIERKSKKSRIFYGCNQYPECDFVSWDKPISRPCPKCASMLVEKKRKKQGVSVACTKCDYQEEADS
jgi:DNA topoisomerase-1